MIKYFLILIIFLTPMVGVSEEINVALEKPTLNIHDKKSIRRGAKFFANNCMLCHTLIYMRYNKIAQEEGVLYEKMPVKVTTWPFNMTPPDLSLEVSRRGSAWVYTYLHSFYVDPTRPTGVNNLVLPNTAMSGILVPFQGQQVKIAEPKELGLYGQAFQWYDLVKLDTQGTMTPEQFDQTITDLVNFLSYASTPFRAEQERMGYWVIGFLMVLFILVYQLKRDYWRTLRKAKRK